MTFKDSFFGFLFLFFILLGIYLFINVEVLIWSITKPEGFWGWVWFLLISSIVGTSIPVIINSLVTLLSWKNSEAFKIGLLLIALDIGALFLYYGIPAYFTNNMQDRYKYINRSERYLRVNEYKKAIQFAEKCYNKEINWEPTSAILVLPYLYDKYWVSDESRALNIYQATINYAFCLQVTGKNMAKADSLYKVCFDIGNRSFPDNKEYLILPLVGRSTISLARGDNKAVNDYYLELLKYCDALTKDDVYQVCNVLHVYSLFSQSTGNLQRAIHLMEKALSIYQASENSKESSYYLSLLTGLIDIYVATDNNKGASELVELADDFAEDKNGKEVYWDYLSTKARYLLSQSMITKEVTSEKKESFFQRLFSSSKEKNKSKQDYLVEAEEILIKINKNNAKNDDKHIDYARSLTILATFYYRTNKYSKAEELFEKALNIALINKDNYLLNYYHILFASALFDYEIGEFENSANKLNQVESFYLLQINENFNILSFEEREYYISIYEKIFRSINSVYANLEDKSLKERLYNNIISIKSIALQSNQYFQQFVLSSGNEDIIYRYNTLKENKEKLSEARISGNIDFESLISKENSLLTSERLLIKEINSLKQFKNLKVNAYTWKDVQQSLKTDEIAIEFINLPNSPTNPDTITYFALIITPDSNSPLLIPLFNEEEILKVLNKKGITRDKVEKVYLGESGDTLKNMIFGPLLGYINKSKKAFISLSGILHQISIPALISEEGYEVHILNTTRDVISKNVSINRCDTLFHATLYGGIDYGNAVTTASKNDSTALSEYDTRNPDIYRAGYANLEYSIDEVDNIALILKEKGLEYDILSGKQATEETFKNLKDHQPKILHIATHGFYFPTERNYRINELLFGLSESSSVLNNPLFRAGLLFAGSNIKNHKGESDDGVLMAFEISKVDLSEVDLVVLSACETGLGDMKGYEGVYGLQRAFKLAGAKNLIISLWKVPDEQTSDLMQRFYSLYLTGLSKNEALQKAQKQMKEYYPNPYYWAAFILVE